MKQLIFISAILILSVSWVSPKQGDIKWNKTTHDFGNLKQGVKVNTVFKYYNHSDTIFEIENVMASCGCVVSNWSRTPLKPGDSSSITVGFDTKGKNRYNEKVITVYSSHGMYDLIIKANITR